MANFTTKAKRERRASRLAAVHAPVIDALEHRLTETEAELRTPYIRAHFKKMVVLQRERRRLRTDLAVGRRALIAAGRI